jgi:murein DD-endopeptidase MepM/ murein hydrolase activator NlpD
VPVRFRNSLFAVLLAIVAVLPNAAATTAVDGTSQQWIWPTSGTITQPYGCTGFFAEPRRGSCAHFHNGIDIANERGTPIRAVADGTVVLVGWDPWIHPDPDWMVIIDHGNGIQSMYAHMRAKPVDGITKGAHVYQGQLIGLMDMTGHATGPHLHFGVYVNGHDVNPRDYLPPGLPAPPASTGTAGPNGCLPNEPVNGVGAGLDGRTAMVPPDDPGNVCTA